MPPSNTHSHGRSSQQPAKKPPNTKTEACENIRSSALHHADEATKARPGTTQSYGSDAPRRLPIDIWLQVIECLISASISGRISAYIERSVHLALVSPFFLDGVRKRLLKRRDAAYARILALHADSDGRVSLMAGRSGLDAHDGPDTTIWLLWHDDEGTNFDGAEVEWDDDPVLEARFDALDVEWEATKKPYECLEKLAMLLEDLPKSSNST